MMNNEKTVLTEVPSLVDITEVVVNNDACVVLKLTADTVTKLATGYLRGNEAYLCVRKNNGYFNAFTVVREDGTSCGWLTAEKVTDELRELGKAVRAVACKMEG